VATSSRTSSPDPAAILDGLRKALAGPKTLFGKADALFPSGAKGKPQAEAAIEQGYLISRSETIPTPPGKRGKPKEVVVGELTDKGRQYVLEADSPKRILESLLPGVQALAARQTSQPRADDFRPELEKVTQACVRAIEDGFAKLQKSVEAACTKLEQAVMKALPTPETGPPLDPRPVLAALEAALSRVSLPAPPGAAATTPGPIPSPPALPVPSPPTPTVQEVKPRQAIPAEQLRAAIRQAYDHLCLFVEFRDKLVEIPRLYHEAVQQLPGLQVERFHRELEALSAERKVELHKLNEVHMAKERALAIEKDDRLYYYVYWK
jgi:hypothetical protein